MRPMKPTTLLGTLILLSAWSSVGATEAGTYSIPKAVNSVEERIAAARSDESWSQLLKPKPHKSLEFAAWGNGRGRGGLTAPEEVVASRMPAMEGDWAMVVAGVTEAVPGATVAVDVAL